MTTSQDLYGALQEILAECRNGGYPNEIVATRMIERIEETASEALTKARTQGGGGCISSVAGAEAGLRPTETQRYLDEANRQLIAIRLNRPTHADLCRLSVMFGRASDLRTDQDVRINEWLKAQLADARGEA